MSVDREIPCFALPKRTGDAINRILREWRDRPQIGASEVADEIIRKRPDIAAGWGESLNETVAAHLRRRWGRR